MSSRFVKILPASFNLLKGAIKDLRGDALMRKHHILFQVVHFHRESGRPQFPFNCLFSRFHSAARMARCGLAEVNADFCVVLFFAVILSLN